MPDTPPTSKNSSTNNTPPTLGSLFQQYVGNPLRNFINPNQSQNQHPQPEQQDINLQNLLQSLAKDELDKSAKEEQKHDNNNTAINPDNPSAIPKQIDPKKNIRNDAADESQSSESQSPRQSFLDNLSRIVTSQQPEQNLTQEPLQQQPIQQPYQHQPMPYPAYQQQMQQPFQQQQSFYPPIPQMTNFLTAGNQGMYGGGMGMAGGYGSYGGYSDINHLVLPNFFDHIMGGFGSSGIGGFGSSGIGGFGSSGIGGFGSSGIGGFGLGGIGGFGGFGMIPPPIFF